MGDLALGDLPAVAAGAPTPLINRDFPDPDVLRVGNSYYAYSTNSTYDTGLRNIPVARASRITGPWTVQPVDALPQPPSWTVFDQGSGTNLIWAPDVSRRQDGKFLMYFAANFHGQVQCIGAALADRPTGPFRNVGSAPLVCRQDEGDIDPSSLTVNGRHYLVYKDNSNAHGQPASIWLQPVAADGLTFRGDRVRLLTADPAGDENNVIEAPIIVPRAGKFVLLYSANPYTLNYHVKFATADRLTGPYQKSSTYVLDSTTWPGVITNPGGQDVVGGQIVFHANIPSGRAMFTAPLCWRGSTPVVVR
ncbi:glycoside hydrolase family 43 protein [Fodinicola feengrottensis]|uniref:glycoside hydrolase family 43 protein n=1 Tax=Fodinicola feengrottensis TaxID=435914 RepID=UPI002442134F|nr:glycoside hydrolase family 43 protein [Fodinicola feengrottensis]